MNNNSIGITEKTTFVFSFATFIYYPSILIRVTALLLIRVVLTLFLPLFYFYHIYALIAREKGIDNRENAIFGVGFGMKIIAILERYKKHFVWVYSPVDDTSKV